MKKKKQNIRTVVRIVEVKPRYKDLLDLSSRIAENVFLDNSNRYDLDLDDGLKDPDYVKGIWSSMVHGILTKHFETGFVANGEIEDDISFSKYLEGIEKWKKYVEKKP